MKNNEPVNIVCPNCEPPVKLVVKTNRQNGKRFLGCPNWPDCSHTEEMPVSIILKEQGQKSLFDAWLNDEI